MEVLFDADCGFCRVGLAVVLRLDRERRLRPVALQSARAKDLLPALTHDERMASLHVVTPDGRVHSAGAALPVLLAALPRGGPAARLAARHPIATERAYRWAASNRSRLGRPLPQRSRDWADRLIGERQRPAGR